jgi:hypothetical protein
MLHRDIIRDDYKSSCCRHAIFGLLLGWVFVLAAEPVCGQMQTASTAFATRGTATRSSMSVQCVIAGGTSISTGEAKIDITNNSGPSTSDRNLEAVVYIKPWDGHSSNVAYHMPIRLAEGQTTVTARIPFVSPALQSMWAVDIFENGRNIRDNRKNRKGELSYSWLNLGNQQHEYQIAGLLASDAKPSRETKNLIALQNLMNDQQTALVTLGTPAGVPNARFGEMLPVGEASADWRNYYRFGTWILSGSAVVEINASFPEVASALRNYLVAGGSLIVYEVNSPEAMRELNRLLKSTIDRDNADSWSSIQLGGQVWWAIDASELEDERIVPKADEVLAGGQIVAAGAAHDAILLLDTWAEATFGGHITNANNILSELGFQDVSPKKLYQTRDKWLLALESEKIVQRPYGNGRVVVATQPLYALSKAQQSHLVFNYYGNNIAMGTHLTRQDRDGEWYFQNIIEEVGKPPVWMFCGIVALFGTLLGPGLLFLTGRIERRSLMIFLAPVISIIATALIVAYGILHEGFDTYVRVHSATIYDVPAGVGFSWSRQNIFSGLPPGDGLQFPRETFVRQVFDTESSRSYPGDMDPRRGQRSNVYVGEKQVWMDTVKPRQHQQFLVGHPIDGTSMPISTERDPASEGLIVTNLTKSALPFVLLRGSNDEYFLEFDLQPREVRQCSANKLEDIASKISKLNVDYKPKVPEELLVRNSLMNFGNSRARWGTGGTGATNDLIMTIFENYLVDKTQLQPFQYVTLLREFDQIAVPVKGKQSSHAHLVLGVDPW